MRKLVLKDIVGLILCIVGAIIAVSTTAVWVLSGMNMDYFFPVLIIFGVGLTTSAIGDSMIEKSKDVVFRGGD
jgi:hypothetical protein